MNHSKKPKVSIIILAYNAKSTLGEIFDEAILSALKQSYSNVEVIVVDNGSTDDTFKYVMSKYSNYVKCVRFPKNYGYCLGNNLAVKYADRDSSYILFQNPDVILSQDYVEKLVEVLEKDSSVAAIQGLEIQPFTGKRRIGGSLNAIGYYYLYELLNHVNIQLCLETLFAFGAALLVRRRLFESVNGFSAKFFLYYDEADLGFKLRALGYRILGCTSPSYQHLVSGTVSKLNQLNPVIEYFNTKNRLRVVLRYFYGFFLAKFLILNLLVFIVHFLRRSAFHRRIALLAYYSILRELNEIIRFRKCYVPKLKQRKVLERFIVNSI